MFSQLLALISLSQLVASAPAPLSVDSVSVPSVSVPSVSVPKITIPTGCPAYYVIEAPGLGDQAGYWTKPTTLEILSKQSGGTRYALQTPPPPDGGKAETAELIPLAVTAANEIVTLINTKYATCPNTKFIVFGYSYGTIVVGMSLLQSSLLLAGLPPQNICADMSISST
jgi:hypothetical protein